MVANIDLNHDELARLCRRHDILRLSLFGSVLRNDFAPGSDVDVLVEFDPQVVVGFRIFRVEEELSRLFGGRSVDLIDPQYVNRCLREPILSSAEVVYDANDGRR